MARASKYEIGYRFKTNNFGIAEIISKLSTGQWMVRFDDTQVECQTTTSQINRNSVRDPSRPRPGTRRSVFVGKTYQTKFHGFCEVIELVDTNHVKIRFLDTGSERIAHTTALQQGHVRDQARTYADGTLQNPALQSRLSVFAGDRIRLVNGDYIKVLEVERSTKIKIQFETTGSIRYTTSRCIRQGVVYDCMRPSVYGHGFYGTYDVPDKRIASLWKGVLQRVYTVKCYSDVTIWEPWLNYSIFAEDLKKVPFFQEWYDSPSNTYHFDKDLIDPSARTYAPHTVSFLEAEDNLLEVRLRKHLNKYPTGPLAESNRNSLNLLRFKYSQRNFLGMKVS